MAACVSHSFSVRLLICILVLQWIRSHASALNGKFSLTLLLALFAGTAPPSKSSSAQTTLRTYRDRQATHRQRISGSRLRYSSLSNVTRVEHYPWITSSSSSFYVVCLLLGSLLLLIVHKARQTRFALLNSQNFRYGRLPCRHRLC